MFELKLMAMVFVALCIYERDWKSQGLLLVTEGSLIHAPLRESGETCLSNSNSVNVMYCY